MSIIKEYWSQIMVAFVVCVALGTAFMEWRIQVNVSQAFTSANRVDPARVTANEKSIRDLEADASKLETKIDKIVDILISE